MFTPSTYFASSEIDLSLPITDSRLVGWYQPLDSGTLSLTGSLIDSIQDKSGDINGGGTVTATGTVRPTFNGIDGMVFNGSNRLSNLSAFTSSKWAVNEWTIFIVLSRSASLPANTVFVRVCNPASGTPGSDIGSGGNTQRQIQRANYSTSGGDIDNGFSLANNTKTILTYSRNVSNNTLYSNLSMVSRTKSNSTLTLATHQLAIGNHGANLTQGFIGAKYEIVMYTTELNNTEIVSTINKLNQRHNAF